MPIIKFDQHKKTIKMALSFSKSGDFENFVNFDVLVLEILHVSVA